MFFGGSWVGRIYVSSRHIVYSRSKFQIGLVEDYVPQTAMLYLTRLL
jgi:hypothetical protein